MNGMREIEKVLSQRRLMYGIMKKYHNPELSLVQRMISLNLFVVWMCF